MIKQFTILLICSLMVKKNNLLLEQEYVKLLCHTDLIYIDTL